MSKEIEEILIEKINKELDIIIEDASKIKKITAASIIGMKQPTILLFLSILSDYKRVLKKNEELKAKWDKDTHILQNELDYANADRIDLVQQNKELRKENNRLEEQVEYDKTHIYTPQIIELNFISKSKIEDKIRRNEEIIDISNDGDLIHELYQENKVYEKLLESEKKI